MKVCKWYDVLIVVLAWILGVLLISGVWAWAEKALYGYSQASSVDTVIAYYLAARFAAGYLRLTIGIEEDGDR